MCDMIPAGIVDPTKGPRSALENAASVASILLTTESLVADGQPAAPPPRGPRYGRGCLVWGEINQARLGRQRDQLRLKRRWASTV